MDNKGLDSIHVFDEASIRSSETDNNNINLKIIKQNEMSIDTENENNSIKLTLDPEELVIFEKIYNPCDLVI